MRLKTSRSYSTPQPGIILYNYMEVGGPPRRVPIVVPEPEQQPENQGSRIDWETVGETAATIGLFAGGIGLMALGAVKFAKTGDPTLVKKGFQMCFG